MITLIAYLAMDYFDNHNILVYLLPVCFDLMLVAYLDSKRED